MTLPDGIQTGTLQLGPWPDHRGGMQSGTITITPRTPDDVPLTHLPTGTALVRRPIEVPFTDQTGVQALTLVATDADGLNVTGWVYEVTVDFAYGSESTPRTKLIALPASDVTVDLDAMAPVATADGQVYVPHLLTYDGLVALLGRVASLEAQLDLLGHSATSYGEGIYA